VNLLSYSTMYQDALKRLYHIGAVRRSEVLVRYHALKSKLS
jgi:hypothetical protein